jgi:hypothetical protein
MLAQNDGTYRQYKAPIGHWSPKMHSLSKSRQQSTHNRLFTTILTQKPTLHIKIHKGIYIPGVPWDCSKSCERSPQSPCFANRGERTCVSFRAVLVGGLFASGDVDVHVTLLHIRLAMAAAKAHAALSNANFPLDPEGRTMHLNVKKGDGTCMLLMGQKHVREGVNCLKLFGGGVLSHSVAHRVVSVGAAGRAEKLATMLDGWADKQVFARA